MKKIFLFALLTFSMNVFAQVSKTVNITAGNLSSTLTASEKSTITNLTVTGTLDARDFKTMRDDMPILAELDLIGSTIEAYNGVEGTSPFGNNDYPANAIPESAFMFANWQGKNSLISVKLPESLTFIGQNAFYSCNGLTSISFPLLCSSIGDDTFSFCSGFTTVFIPSSLISIGVRAFMGCSGLINVAADNPNFSSLDGVLFDKEKTTLIQFPTSKTGAYTVPESVIKIGQYAFYKFAGLTSVIIPTTVTSIGDYAFSFCTGLISANLPQSLSYIGVLAFYNCTNLDGTLSIPSTVSSIGHDAFSHCLNLDVVNIPSTVTTIGNYSFYDCGGLINVDNNNPNYSSEDGILFNKTKTTLMQCPSSWHGSYTIPSSVKIIGPSAFSRCIFLTVITIPSSVTSFGTNAFWGCSSLTGTMTIPSSVTFIGSFAFYGCTQLTSIRSYPVMPVDLSISNQVFYNVNKFSCSLYVPKGSMQAYQSAYQWYEFQNITLTPQNKFAKNREAL